MTGFVKIWVSSFILFLPLLQTAQPVVPAPKEEKYTRFIRFGYHDGLTNSEINCIIRDSTGFVWLGTENGLFRFDGYNFIRFSFADFHQEGSDIITSLAFKSNMLFIGTDGGLFTMNTLNGNISRGYYPETDTLGHLKMPVRKIEIPNSKQINIETLDGKLAFFSDSSKEWRFLSHPKPSQPYYHYHALFTDKNQNLWFGGRNLGLHKLTPNHELIHYKAGGNKPGYKRDEDVADIFCSSTGQYYVVATDGIYLFYPETGRFDKILANSAFSIAEEKKGIIWFGSGNGLLKWDEKKSLFTVYRYNLDNIYSISENHINVLYFDRDTNLWIGTKNGLNLLPAGWQKYDIIYRIPGNEQSLSSNHISSLVQDNENILWAATYNHGINRIDLLSGENTVYRHQPEKPGSLTSDAVSVLYIDKRQNLWVGLWSGRGFCLFDRQKEKFRKFVFDSLSLKRDWYNAFLEDSKGNFWVGLWGSHGLHLFDRTKQRFLPDYFMLPHSPYNQQVKKIVQLKDKRIFLIANNTLVYEYHPENKSFSVYCAKNYASLFKVVPTHEFLRQLPFSFSKIYTACSNENKAWFITDKGVILYDQLLGFESLYTGDILSEPIHCKVSNDTIWFVSRKNIYAIWENGNKKFNLEKIYPDIGKTVVQSIIQIKKGEIVFGTDIGVLTINYMQPKYQIKFFNQFDKKEIFIPMDTPGNFCLSSGNKLIAFRGFEKTDSITWNNNYSFHFSFATNTGIYIISPEEIISLKLTEGKFSDKKIYKGNFPPKIVSAVALDDSTLLTTDSLNLLEINLTTSTAKMVSKPDKYMLASHLITCITEWYDGSIFTGSSDKGLTWINPSSGATIHFNTLSPKRNYLFDSITSIVKAKYPFLWIGTSRGLFFLNTEDTTIHRYNLDRKIQNITSLVYNGDSLIYVGHLNEISVINVNTGKNVMIKINHMIPDGNLTKASCLLNDRRVAFGTDKGIVIFNPVKLIPSAIAGKTVIFTYFSLFDKTLSYFIQQNDTFNLKYTDNYFSIGFSAFGFAGEKMNDYQYRLKGIDKQWITTTKREAVYSHLKPGLYCFEVSISGETRPEKFNYIYFNILPPFWQTTWFLISIAGIVISILAYILISYIKRLKIINYNIELEQKFLASQMNPHFIFNALSAIQSFMYNNNPEEAGNYLSGFSRLVRLILQNSRAPLISLEEEILTLQLYLKLQKLRFADKFDFEIITPPSQLTDELMVPPMIAQPFIENSIEHGIMHKQGKGFISVTLNIDGRVVCITITDDGIGIKKSEEINRNQRRHTSYATSITRERLKVLEKHHKIKSEIQVIDREESEQTQGTQVIIKIPYLKTLKHDKSTDYR